MASICTYFWLLGGGGSASKKGFLPPDLIEVHYSGPEINKLAAGHYVQLAVS